MQFLCEECEKSNENVSRCFNCNLNICDSCSKNCAFCKNKICWHCANDEDITKKEEGVKYIVRIPGMGIRVYTKKPHFTNNYFNYKIQTIKIINYYCYECRNF